MHQSLRRFGNGIRLLVLAVCALAVVIGASRGQPPPFPQPPPFQPQLPPPPKFQPPEFKVPLPIEPNLEKANPGRKSKFPSTKTWTCSNCKMKLGVGSMKPNWTSCPGCNARFIGGGGGGGLPIMHEAPEGPAEPPAIDPPLLPVDPLIDGDNAIPRNPNARAQGQLSGTFWIIMVAVVFVVLLFVAVGVVAFLALRKPSPPKKSRRRVKDY